MSLIFIFEGRSNERGFPTNMVTGKAKFKWFCEIAVNCVAWLEVTHFGGICNEP